MSDEEKNFVGTLRKMRSPAGDLYLPPTFADQLFRWMEIVEGMLKNRDEQVASYKEIIAIYKGESNALNTDVPANTQFPSES